jgi:hypothetical protein
MADTLNSGNVTLSDIAVRQYLENARKLSEHIDAQVHEIGQQVGHLVSVLEEYRPLMAMLKKPDGKPDMIGALQLGRRARRAAAGR